MKNIKEETSFKPTLDKPVSDQSKRFEKNFNSTMSQNNVNLDEVDGLLTEKEQSLKKKIFSLPKMEALVFSDPKLTTVYDEMAENGEEKYGYHYNETIMNMIFNDWVLNSPKYLQKYKMAVPKKKKRRDKSGINQLKKISKTPTATIQPQITDETTGAASSGAYVGPAAWKKGGDLMEEPEKVEETTTSASSGAYVTPAAWGSGDLMKGKASPVMRKPIWQGGKIIQESDYLTDPSGFEKFVDMLCEQINIEEPNRSQVPNVKPDSRGNVNREIIDGTSAFNSDTVKAWGKGDTNIQYNTMKTGKVDNPNFQHMEEEKMDEKAKSKAQQRLFGMARAVQKGELSPSKVGGDVKKIAKTVSAKDVEDFASTKHKKLPEKVDELALNEFLSLHDTVEYVSDRNGEEPFEMHGDKWQFVNGRYPNGKVDIAVYRYGTDLAYDYERWREEMNINETDQSMIGDTQSTMANKPQATGTVTTGGVPVGLTDMKENYNLLEEIDNELNAYSIHQNKLKKIAEDRKPSALVLKDRLGDENASNFKKDLGQSGTKDIINVEKELMYKDQQTDVGDDPQKLGQDIEKKALQVTKGQSFDNVGNSDNDKGNEIPKRNLTKEEQDEVNMYRLGQQDLVYDNEPSQRFEDRMKADMGDTLYKQRQDKLDFRAKAPMYNKDTQPTEEGIEKSQFDKNKSGWNERSGLEESMVTGRYHDALNKSHIIDFTINEALAMTPGSEESLFKLDFTGLGNSYRSKTENYKVSVNESVVNVLEQHSFYTDGKNVYFTKNNAQNLSEGEVKSTSAVNENVEKMKHLLGYNPNKFVNTNNIKKNRGF